MGASAQLLLFGCIDGWMDGCMVGGVVALIADERGVLNGA
jgi:hypothetical protein